MQTLDYIQPVESVQVRLKGNPNQGSPTGLSEFYKDDRWNVFVCLIF